MFLIQTDPKKAHLHGPNTMTYGSDGRIWGPVGKSHLFSRYDTQEMADFALTQIDPKTVAFYGLAVVEEQIAKPQSFGTQGWMKNHPGYDLA